MTARHTDPTCYHRDTCRLCGGTKLDIAVHLQPTPIADAFLPVKQDQPLFGLNLYLCRECGHVQLLDVVNPDLLFRDYIYVTKSSPGLVEHFRLLADKILSVTQPPAGSLVVDIGSNDGSSLSFYRKKGFRVLGIDPATEIARQASADSIETISRYFSTEVADEIRRDRGGASIVMANNVFAHADNLGQMAEGIRILLNQDGVFEFEVNYLVDIVDNMLFDTVYHEHLCYHTVRPLDAFLRRHGMELFAIDRLPVKGGSLRCFAQLQSGPRKRNKSVDDLIELETRRRFDQPCVFRDFEARIDNARTHVCALLQQLKASGKTVAGYGASPTVTTLLYQFDLGSVIEFLVDDNPRKYGTFSPGHHIPVSPSQALYERKPHCVVILAWRFADPIIKKHQPFLDSGGHFLIPLPTPVMR